MNKIQSGIIFLFFLFLTPPLSHAAGSECGIGYSAARNNYGGFSNAGFYPNHLGFVAMKENGSISAWHVSESTVGNSAPTDAGYISIASTSGAFAAMKEDESITAWGGASEGAPADTGYISIASTGSAFAALKEDGSISDWGNYFLGDHSAPTDTGYISIASTEHAFAAMKEDGSISAWGESPAGAVSGTPTDDGYVSINGVGPNTPTDCRDTIYPQCNTTFALPANQWQQISLPCDPKDKNTVADVFGDDGLGAYDTDWVLYRYGPGGYSALTPTDTLSQGEGYWIIQLNNTAGANLKMPANSTPAPLSKPTGCLSTSQGCFEIVLMTQPNPVQWNMIGYPFTASGNLSNMQVLTTGGNCVSGCDLDTAETDGIVHNEFWTYEGAAYTTVDSNGSFDPWKGYWSATLNLADGLGPKLVVPKP